ncbi:MAG: hypothetical protein K9J13_11395 [Saprospiraceae bacterium]|nr:hypothetical protein [Saprospiraceae bacterium]
MEIILTIFYTALFIFLIYKMEFFAVDGIAKKYFVGVFALKIFAGLIMFLMYSYYYDKATADIFRFFDDGKVIYNAAYEKPWDYIRFVLDIGTNAPELKSYIMEMNNWGVSFENSVYGDSHILIQFNALIMLFSFGNYFVHILFICFVSLLGLTAIFKFFYPLFKNKKWELFIIIFLIPSVVFWGSGVLKEGLLLFGIGFLIYYFKVLINKQSIFKSIIWILFSVYLLSLTKFFVIGLLIPLLLSFLWTNKAKKFVGLKYLAVILVFLIIGLNLHFISPKYDFLELISKKQANFISLAIENQSSSLITKNAIEPDLWSFTKATPVSIFNSLFRPHIFEANTILMKFSAIENIFVLLSIILALIFIKIKDIDKSSFYLALSFAICTFIIIGFTPITGAIVRYKIIALPFFLISLLMIFDKQKFLKRFRFKK